MDDILPIKCGKSKSTSLLSRILLFSFPFPGLLDAESVRCAAVSSHSICIQSFFYFFLLFLFDFNALICGCDKTQTCVSFPWPPGGRRRCPCCPRWTTRSWRRTWWKGRTGCAPCCSRRCAGWVCHFTSSQPREPCFPASGYFAKKNQKNNTVTLYLALSRRCACVSEADAFSPRRTKGHGPPGLHQQRSAGVARRQTGRIAWKGWNVSKRGDEWRGFFFLQPLGLCLFCKEIWKYLKWKHDFERKENVFMIEVKLSRSCTLTLGRLKVINWAGWLCPSFLFLTLG